MKTIRFSHLTHNKLFRPGVSIQRGIPGPAGISQNCTSSLWEFSPETDGICLHALYLNHWVQVRLSMMYCLA